MRIADSVPALVWILPSCQRLRKKPIGQQILHVPFGRALRLPSPKDPASSSLVGVELRFDKVPEVVFVDGGESGDGTGSFAVAATVVAVPRQRAVVTSAFTKAVEPFGATVKKGLFS